MLNAVLRLTPAACLLAGLCLSNPAMAIQGSGAEYGARDPGGCDPVQLDGAPTKEQVVSMLRCKHEVATSTGELWLMQNVKVSVGKPTNYVIAYGDYIMDDGDVDSTAYGIIGSFTWSVCKTKADAAKYGEENNCYEQDVPAAKGICWKTTFGDYRCRFVGSIAETRKNTAPPQ